MHPYTTSEKFLNFTTLDWEHEFPSRINPATSNEILHHALISIFLVESAAIYFSASLLLRSLERDEDIYQHFCVRSIRFSAITIIDACTILIHKVVVNAETQAQYSLRIDGFLLMCLNFLLLVFMP